MSASVAASGRRATVDTTFFWPAVVPSWSTAAGISGSIPASRRLAMICGSAVTPIKNTSVPSDSTSAR